MVAEEGCVVSVYRFVADVASPSLRHVCSWRLGDVGRGDVGCWVCGGRRLRVVWC